MKLQESKNRFFISIPKEIIKSFRWKKGDELIVKEVKNNSIIITKDKK